MKNKALTFSTIGVVWLVVFMALLTEISAPFKALLTQFAGHHWTAKSIIAVIAFLLFYSIFRNMNESNDVFKDVLYVVGSVVLGGLIIFSYYLFNFLGVSFV